MVQNKNVNVPFHGQIKEMIPLIIYRSAKPVALREGTKELMKTFLQAVGKRSTIDPIVYEVIVCLSNLKSLQGQNFYAVRVLSVPVEEDSKSLTLQWKVPDTLFFEKKEDALNFFVSPVMAFEFEEIDILMFDGKPIKDNQEYLNILDRWTKI